MDGKWEKLTGFSFQLLGFIFVLAAVCFPLSDPKFNINMIMHGIILFAIGSLYLKVIQLFPGKINSSISINSSTKLE